MAEEQQPTQQTQGLGQWVSANRGLAALIAMAALGLIMIFIFGVLLLRSLNRQAEVAQPPAGTPTPFPEGATGQIGRAEPLIVGVSDSATVTVTLDMPATLLVNGRTFAVQPQVLGADGIWSPGELGGETAVWVYGSIINYVLGIAATPENRTLLEQLTPGDTLILTTRGGTEHRFVFESRNLYPVNSRDIVAQTTPGLTLALLRNSGQDRLVVRGAYVVPEARSGAGNLFNLGETAQLENLQITVTGASYIPDRPEVPTGFAFVLIDFQLQNLALTALDTSGLQLLLLDSLGNQYALNGIASQLGNNPPLSGFVNANQIVQATVGYQVPLNLSADTLNWVVRRAASGSQITIAVPFPGGARAAQSLSTVLQSAAISPDGTGLVLSGQVVNLGSQLAVVSEQNLSLRTSDGATYLLLSTNPAFPWAINPGQAQTFTVMYQRPFNADTAVFTLLNQPFQLSSLR